MDEAEMKKKKTGKNWTETALKIGKHIAIVGGTAFLSGVAMALGGMAVESLRTSRGRISGGDVHPLRKIG